MIQVFFGNLTVKQLEERTGWEFSKEDYEWLNSHRQDNATVRSDGNSFHIFDLPFLIDVAPSIKDELLTILTKENNRVESKEAVQITVATETEEEKRERERRRKLLLRWLLRGRKRTDSRRRRAADWPEQRVVLRMSRRVAFSSGRCALFVCL